MATDTTKTADSVEPTEKEVDPKAAPLGKPSDVLHLEGTTTPKEHKEVEAVAPEDQKDQPVTSLETLKEYHRKRGTQPTHDEVDAVRKLEKQIEAEGAKHHRGPSASVDKPGKPNRK